jgi:hypothetical protein
MQRTRRGGDGVRFWKKKEEKKKNHFMIMCEKCWWNFTDEYIQKQGENPRPFYGDVCSCGGTVVRVDGVEVTA